MSLKDYSDNEAVRSIGDRTWYPWMEKKKLLLVATVLILEGLFPLGIVCCCCGVRLTLLVFSLGVVLMILYLF